jgi:hypothetical protein
LNSSGIRGKQNFGFLTYSIIEILPEFFVENKISGTKIVEFFRNSQIKFLKFFRN